MLAIQLLITIFTSFGSSINANVSFLKENNSIMYSDSNHGSESLNREVHYKDSFPFKEMDTGHEWKEEVKESNFGQQHHVNNARKELEPYEVTSKHVLTALSEQPGLQARSLEDGGDPDLAEHLEDRELFSSNYYGMTTNYYGRRIYYSHIYYSRIYYSTYCGGGTYYCGGCCTCPSGNYCPGGDSSSYYSCPAGYYCPYGASSYFSCPWVWIPYFYL